MNHQGFVTNVVLKIITFTTLNERVLFLLTCATMTSECLIHSSWGLVNLQLHDSCKTAHKPSEGSVSLQGRVPGMIKVRSRDLLYALSELMLCFFDTVLQLFLASSI